MPLMQKLLTLVEKDKAGKKKKDKTVAKNRQQTQNTMVFYMLEMLPFPRNTQLSIKNIPDSPASK